MQEIRWDIYPLMATHQFRGGSLGVNLENGKILEVWELGDVKSLVYI
jgi:hypothetical protein